MFQPFIRQDVVTVRTFHNAIFNQKGKTTQRCAVGNRFQRVNSYALGLFRFLMESSQDELFA
jgi:hypothetical protein